MGKEIRLVFAEEKTRDAFYALKVGDGAERKIFSCLDRAFEEISRNPRCGKRIPKRLWPKDYTKKYLLTNLLKYDLPDGWRLTYTVDENEVLIMAMVLEWFDHKGYERRFGY